MSSPSTRATRATRRSERLSPPTPPRPRTPTPPDAAPVTNSETVPPKRAAMKDDADQPAPKRRRRISPASATPQPAQTPEPSTTPRPAPAKAARPRPSTSTTAPTRTTAAVLREEARQSRVPSPTTHDESAQPAAPRVGMGQVFPHPPDSDIRGEARYIIETATRHREQERSQNVRQLYHKEAVQAERPITSSPNSDPTYHYPTHPLPGPVYPTPLATGVFHSNALHYATAGPSSYTAQSVPGPSSYTAQLLPGPSTSARRQSETALYPLGPNESFESQYAALQSAYEQPVAPIPQPQAYLPVVSPMKPQEEPRPPKFHGGQRPVVVLSQPASGRARPRDKLEKAHQEGFEGLTLELIADSAGFVENVRVSPRARVPRVADKLYCSCPCLHICFRSSYTCFRSS